MKKCSPVPGGTRRSWYAPAGSTWTGLPRKRKRASVRKRKKPCLGPILLAECLPGRTWIPPPGKLYARSLFDGLRYPEGKICEDVPVTYRAALKANKVALLPEPIYNYYHRPGSITTAPVSQKSFHFAAHTQEIVEDIRARCPEILPQAKYLRVWSLAHPMMLCQESNQVAAFREEYKACKRELAKELPFLLGSPLFSKKEKLHDLLLVLGLFGPAWRLTGHRRNP